MEFCCGANAATLVSISKQTPQDRTYARDEDRLARFACYLKRGSGGFRCQPRHDFGPRRPRLGSGRHPWGVEKAAPLRGAEAPSGPFAHAPLKCPPGGPNCKNKPPTHGTCAGRRQADGRLFGVGPLLPKPLSGLADSPAACPADHRRQQRRDINLHGLLISCASTSRRLLRAQGCTARRSAPWAARSSVRRAVVAQQKELAARALRHAP